MQATAISTFLVLLSLSRVTVCCKDTPQRKKTPTTPTSGPSKTPTPTATATTAPAPSCVGFSRNVTSRCNKFAPLKYNRTSAAALAAYEQTLDAFPANRLCNYTNYVQLNCSCTSRVVKFAWRLLLPRCTTNGSTVHIHLPCRSYCHQLYNDCGAHVPTELARKIEVALNVSSLNATCSLLNDTTPCWTGNSSGNGCATTTTAPTPTTPPNTSPSAGGLSTAVIGGIAGALAFLILATIVLAIFCVKCKNKKKPEANGNDAAASNYGMTVNVAYQGTEAGGDVVEAAYVTKEQARVVDVSAMYAQVRK